MASNERNHINRASARTAVNNKLLGMARKAFSENSDSASNIARTASGGKNKINNEAQRNPSADYDTLDRIDYLEQKGVEVPYEQLAKMDRDEIREAVRSAYETYEEKYEKEI